MQLALHLHTMWPNAIPGNEVEQHISKLIWLILLQGSLCDYLTSQIQISLQRWKKNPIQHLIVTINKSGNNNIKLKKEILTWIAWPVWRMTIIWNFPCICPIVRFLHFNNLHDSSDSVSQILSKSKHAFFDLEKLLIGYGGAVPVQSVCTS
jgi:hypothetical protein